MIRILILLLTTVLAPGVLAQETSWYEIELIVFEHTGPPGPGDERITVPLDYPLLDEAEQLIPPPPGDPDAQAHKVTVPYAMLRRDEYRLLDEAQRLEQSSRYQMLLHVAWRQPVSDRRSARPVHLFSGMEKQDIPVPVNDPAYLPLEPAGPPVPANADAAAVNPPPVQPETIAPPALEGTVRISVGRYLHLETDLVYRTPVSVPASPEPGSTAVDEPAVVYLMREARRMRSKELHYLDHPRISMLASIVPYEPPQPEPVEEPAAMGNGAAGVPDADQQETPGRDTLKQ